MNALPLPDGRVLQGELRDSTIWLTCDGQPLMQLRTLDANTVQLLEVATDDLADVLWCASYWWFAAHPQAPRIVWRGLDQQALQLCDDWLRGDAGGASAQVERSVFWQLPQPWLRQALPPYPQQMVMSEGKRHPRRRAQPEGEVYRRFDARLGAWISLRTLDIDQDLQRFNRWQNTPRVLHFWQEGGDLEQHRKYLETIAADPHVYSLIGCFDDLPFAYFELYWAKEDRIAPFYVADDYDRGIHMLVGEQAHRGPHKVASWLAALTHYALLDDPRTNLVVAEPRADNAKMIGYMQTLGYYREKEFDFPHKRAALMAIGRERFFDSGVLC
ncbi:GNAT family N-acetyltransferase [Pseudomonas mendocina]|uniref:GNAT family N-acetyltransferase n=1 Tax=Ectopseudomonas mendocina TaxID=300 RepID=UPI0023DA6672|nr:GNAT family N-acetyltransferase [Pseudomonas mendocina]MDF2076409.1 GNAT family N-acetyltransferase [Pseudomonas mendocina]